MGTLIITHYTRILEYVKPDFVHIMLDGRIVREGGPELADELEEKGYEFVREEVAAANAGRRPSWLEERRAEALEAYEREPVPTWRRSGFWTTSLRDLDLDALEARHYEPSDELPPLRGRGLGDDELGGLVVQRGASTIHVAVDPELAEQGVIVSSLEQAVEEHPTWCASGTCAGSPTTRASSPPPPPRSGPAAPSSTCPRTCSVEHADPDRRT